MFRIGTTLLIILAIAAGLIIGTLNSTRVTLDLLWVQLHWPLGLLTMLFLAFGLLLGVLACYLLQVLPLRMRLRKQARALAAPVEDPATSPDD